MAKSTNTEQEPAVLTLKSEPTGPVFLNEEAASDALGINVETLRAWKRQTWFPKDGYQHGKGYDVDKVKASKTMQPGSDAPAYVINRQKFTPVCPRSPDHRAKVYRTNGRVRHCICNDCGHEWQQAGEFADIRLETLKRIAELLENAERTAVQDGNGGTVNVILIDDRTAKEAASYCRGAIRAKA